MINMDNKELLLRPARPEELEKVVDFYNYIIDAQEGQEYTPKWTRDVYPSLADMQSAVDAGHMHLGLLDGKTVCAEVITGNDDIYERVDWHYDAKEEEVTVIHLLCVLPEYYGRGFAKEMIRYAVDLSRDIGRKVIRLDVIEGNKRAANLYLSEGFEYVGEYQVYYEDTGLADFWMYEKPL